MKQKEIEIKLIFKNKNKIINKLKPEIKLERKISIYDKYFSKDFLDMKNTHNLIRIRKINNNNDAELTFKSKTKNQGNIWQRTELTTTIQSPEIMEKILTHLGFKKISEYKSQREYWKFQDLEIIFIKFTKPAFLEFMEIEGKPKKILEVIKKLGNNVKEVGEEIFEIFDLKRKGLN
jgi:predicted adenylyl cyclase CyaB